ncbi:glycoside hydrolase family 2 TIM barrel-domain containing protein [Hymenobacter terrigena]
MGLLLGCSGPAERPPAAVQRGYSAKSVVAVRVEKTGHGYRLLRGDQPYFLRGGGGLQQFAQLRAAGGNTVRLWSTDYAGPLLDAAHSQGLTVMLGIWLEPESKYFTYYDPAMVQAQRQRVRQQVLRFRHHPALLMWNVGNELELTAPGPRLFNAINELALMIHELDPYHPVTYSLSNIVGKAAEFQRLAPAVDILSINIYGGMSYLPVMLKMSGWHGPYIVSEYGGNGYWETDSTGWQVPIEQTSATKAAFMSTRYRQVIAHDSACLGGYVFYWGSKFEYTPTWFSLFEPTGEKTELVDELQLLWKGHYPANRCPHLTEMRLDGKRAVNNVQLVAGRSYPAVVTVSDPEGDSLTTRWQMLPEMRYRPGIKEVTTPLEPLAGLIMQTGQQQALVRMPSQPGLYRLYARVFDGHGGVGTANIPVLVRAASVPAVSYSATTRD